MSKLLVIVVLIVCALTPFTGLSASESAVDVPLRGGVRGIHMSPGQQTVAVEPQPILTPEERRYQRIMDSLMVVVEEHPFWTAFFVILIIAGMISSWSMKEHPTAPGVNASVAATTTAPSMSRPVPASHASASSRSFAGWIAELASATPAVPPRSIVGKIGRTIGRITLAIAIMVGGGVVVFICVWIFK